MQVQKSSLGQPVVSHASIRMFANHILDALEFLEL
jgi:hypothetical protein